jgi:TolB-like protein/predicted Ser/Thr protein kinase/Flp pilus assembly protein TadD
VGACFSQAARARIANPMTSEENRRVPVSTEVSPRETEVDPQLSACVNDGSGPPPQEFPETHAPEQRRSATGRAQADVSPSTMRLAIGQLLGGRYRIERELGEGGMGVVYLAADEQVPGERFAIKVLKEELHAEALTLLREEVRKTRKLSHANIVDVHSVNVDGQRLYILMEYLEGRSLYALLDEEFGRGMSFSHAWPIIEDVGAALANAHDHNVIHSDLKPANVFVTTAGRTKLLDFGIARVSRGPLLRPRLGPRALTPTYASCEMLEGKEADRRDDIYSFACVTYETLCGERPFGELTALEARDAGTKVPPLQGLSGGQNAALARALAFERESRTASVEKFLEGLATEHPARSRPAALLGAGVIALAGAAGLTYFALDRLRVSEHSVVVGGATSNAQQAVSLATAPTTAAFNPPPHSIAVLPFVNMSGDPKQEYFSDGLSEELIDHLVHSADLKVIARTSSFQFKGRNEDVRSIARELGVTHVLEGSVRKADQQLRITAELVSASDGVHLWSHTYDRKLTDIFKVQGEIADEVSHALHVALRNGYRATDREPDVQAYNLLLEGRYFEARGTPRNVEKSAELYKRTVDRDPEYALGWARLAHACLIEETQKGPPSEEQNRRVLDALDRAIRLDPNLVYAYYTRAAFEMNITWNWAAALADDQHIREIDSQSDLLPGAFGDHALVFGQVNRAIELYQEALTRNPLDPNTLDSLGIALCAANRFQPCLQSRLRLMQLHPEFDGVNSSVGMARLYLGQFAAALAAMQREPNEDYRLRGLAAVFWAMGRRTESDAALKALTDKFASIDSYGIAAVHAYRGEIDDAFRWLDRAYQEHNHGMPTVKTDPPFTNLRGDPRFQALLSRMGFADQ